MAMSAVRVHVGQCANQIVEEWWQILTSENVPHAEADRCPFCSPDGKLSAICVDSERTVVRKPQKRVTRGLDQACTTCSPRGLTVEPVGKRQGGAARFAPCPGGAHLMLQPPRSWLCEAIRDEYSLGQMPSVTVALRQPGESPLEHCDSLLCLSWLQRYVTGGWGVGQGTVFWDSVASSVVHSLPREFHPAQPHYSASVLAVARSYQEATFLLSHDSVLRKLKQAYRCVPWKPFPLRCWTDSLNIVEPGCHSHLLTDCANHSSSAELLQQVVARAEAMYETNAYLHWYWRYGCEEEDFQQASETLCSVADDYSQLGV
ncbi:uncharacterized protein ACDP82_001297 [Pangshura tecta]